MHYIIAIITGCINYMQSSSGDNDRKARASLKDNRSKILATHECTEQELEI